MFIDTWKIIHKIVFYFRQRRNVFKITTRIKFFIENLITVVHYKMCIIMNNFYNNVQQSKSFTKKELI